MKGIKVLLAVFFVFLSCNTVFANVADIKSEANTPGSLSLMMEQNGSAHFVLAAFKAGNGDLVNYRRGRHKDGEVTEPVVEAIVQGRGRGRGGRGGTTGGKFR